MAKIPSVGEELTGRAVVTSVVTDETVRKGKHYKIRAHWETGPFKGSHFLITVPVEEAKSTQKSSGSKGTGKGTGRRGRPRKEETDEDSVPDAPELE